MEKISKLAAARLTNDQTEFVNVLGNMRGRTIYDAGFTIAVHSKVFDMLYNNTLNCEYLSDLIECNESPIVNLISADYVLKGYTDFNDLEEFVRTKIDELKPQ